MGTVSLPPPEEQARASGQASEARTPPTGTRRTSLREIFESVEGSDDLDLVFARHTLDRTASTDPRLPDLLRCGAVPRYLDLGVLSALVEDGSANLDELFAQIAGQPFVSRSSLGELHYHDNVRDALLREWHTSEEQSRRFAELSLRLARHYDASYASACRLEAHLTCVGRLMRATAPSRFARLTDFVQSTMAKAVTEALHHRLSASLDEGVQELELMFQNLQTDGHVRLCRQLVATARDHLERLPPEEVGPHHWSTVAYFESRVVRDLPPQDHARGEQLLRDLLRDESLDPRLRVWALSDLADACESRLRMNEALEIRAQLHDSGDEDRWNRPLRYLTLGNAYVWTSQREEAVVEFRRTVAESADPDARQDLTVSALLQLSNAEADMGRLSQASEHLVEALHRVRTDPNGSVWNTGAVAARAASLLAQIDSTVSLAIVEEGIAAHRLRSARDALDLLIGHRMVLSSLGLVRLAACIREREAELIEDAQDETRLAVGLLAEAADLESRGELRRAEETFTRCIDWLRGQREPAWELPQALDARGDIRIRLAAHRQAVQDLTESASIWRASGCVIDAARSDVEHARGLIRLDLLDDAEALLVAADGQIPNDGSVFRGALDRALGELHKMRGNRDLARECYTRALGNAVDLDRLSLQLEVLEELTDLAVEGASWAPLAGVARQVGQAARRLAGLDDPARSPAQLRAAEANAAGTKALIEGGNRRLALARARDLFHGATELDPGNWWYFLNLSYVCAEQRDWLDAGAALSRAIELAPALLRTQRLLGCMAAHTRQQALEFHSSAEPGSADSESLGIDDASGTLAVGLVRDVLDRHGSELAPHDQLTLAATVFGLAALHGDAETEHRSGALLVKNLADHGDPMGGSTALGEQTGSDVSAAVIAALRDLVLNVSHVWALDNALEQLTHEGSADEATTLIRVRAGVRAALDDLFGTGAISSWTPGVRPVMLDVGDELVPLVDSQLDGGLFLFELVPDMRQRLVDHCGVVVPGVRARSNPNLPPDGYAILVNGVAIASGRCRGDSRYACVPTDGSSDAGLLVDFDPVTGQRAAWRLEELAFGHEAVAPQVPLSPAQLLCAVLEAALRGHLDQLFGLDDATRLVAEWSAHGATSTLAREVLGRPKDRLRLAPILRELLRQRVCVSDASAVMRGIAAAGGTGMPTRDVVASVRRELRPTLPGHESGRTRVQFPEGPELAARTDSSSGAPAELTWTYDALGWLRGQVAAHGRWITVTVSSEAVRRRLAPVIADEDEIVAVLTAEEAG